MAESIADTHHEKWNGTGYPRGRREDEIPRHARIVTIAEVVDALSYDRPYCRAWVLDRVIAELRTRCCGRAGLLATW